MLLSSRSLWSVHCVLWLLCCVVHQVHYWRSTDSRALLKSLCTVRRIVYNSEYKDATKYCSSSPELLISRANAHHRAGPSLMPYSERWVGSCNRDWRDLLKDCHRRKYLKLNILLIRILVRGFLSTAVNILSQLLFNFVFFVVYTPYGNIDIGNVYQCI